MPLVRGWCPTIFDPMPTGDGLLLRLKPGLGRLRAADAGWIASAARQYGNGILELTARANLQLRGFDREGVEILAGLAQAARLASPEPAAERRRNVVVSPMAAPDVARVAQALERRLVLAAGLDGLPGKFGFGVDAGGVWALPDQAADIVLRRTGAGWTVSGAGGESRSVSQGEVVDAVLDRASAWLASGEARSPKAAVTQPDLRCRAVGWLPAYRAHGFGLPFGEMDAAALERLASLAAEAGEGVLHLTPWRTILIGGLDRPADRVPGLIDDPGDPRLGVSACIGARGCDSGSVDARGDAAEWLRRGVAVTHVSGCAKGCAHPAASPLTLVGSAGRYGLVRGGRAGDTPQCDGLSPGDVGVALAAPSPHSFRAEGRVDHQRL